MTVFDFSSRPLATAATRNRLLSAGLFTTLSVTLWSTILIAYRIYSASNDILNQERPRFYNVLEMITQSSVHLRACIGGERAVSGSSTEAVERLDDFHGWKLRRCSPLCHNGMSNQISCYFGFDTH